MSATPEEIEACRERNGAAAEERPAFVDEALGPDEIVGFGDGEPLADRPYAEYVEDLYTQPDEARAFLEEVAAHDLVNNTQSLAEEVGVDEDTAADVIALYEIDLPTNGFDLPTRSTKPDDKFVVPGGEEWPLDMIADDPAADERILTALLAECGMSVDEAARYIERELKRIKWDPNEPQGRGLWRTRPHEVRQFAKDAGLLADDRDDSRRSVPEEYSSYDGGLTYDASTF